MTVREQIVDFLERWDDLTGLSSAAGGQGEARVPLQAHDRGCGVYSSLRCTCWLQGVAELEVCLRELRRLGDGRYRHLQARYGETVKQRRRFVRYRANRWEGLEPNEAVLIPRFDQGSKGSRERVYEDVLVVRWPDWVQLSIVEEAIVWLTACCAKPLERPIEQAAA